MQETERERREMLQRPPCHHEERSLKEKSPICKGWQSTRGEKAWVLEGIRDLLNQNRPWNHVLVIGDNVCFNHLNPYSFFFPLLTTPSVLSDVLVCVGRGEFMLNMAMQVGSQLINVNWVYMSRKILRLHK